MLRRAESEGGCPMGELALTEEIKTLGLEKHAEELDETA